MQVGREDDGLLPVRIIDLARTHHTSIPFVLGDWRIRVP
jgi:hypothetical protein